MMQSTNELRIRCHPWDLSPADAAKLQQQMSIRVREVPLIHPVHKVLGLDVSIKHGMAHAAAVVVAVPGFTRVDQATWSARVTYPYVPGLLAFREIPPILQVLKRLRSPWDVIMADGHGRAHPRGFGLACHLGVLLDMPCAGVAKRPYVGAFSGLGKERGAMVPLTDMNNGSEIGMAVRTRSHVRPVFVSVGHKITLPEAVRLTLRCVERYRIPEPLRQAHLLSRQTFDPKGKLSA